jgi:hypothetical protein
MNASEYEDFEIQLWKCQQDDMSINEDEVRSEARRREVKAVSAYWIVLTLTVLLAAGFVRNLIYLRSSWVVLGTAWALVALGVVSWRLLRNGPNRRQRAEPCALYLRRALQTKRASLLCIRWLALLMVPAILACWVGGGPVLRAKALGFSAPVVLHLLAGPIPLITFSAIIAFVWFAFTRQARKVELEIARIRVQES